MRVKLTKKLTWDSILLVLLVALGTFAFLAILFFFLVFLVVELIFIFILYIPGYSLAICARLCVTRVQARCLPGAQSTPSQHCR